MKSLQLNITGRVQGVYYRASTVEVARQLALKGWVQNESDGSVSICVQGAETDLNQLIAWCHQGSEQAQVNTVDVKEISADDLEGVEGFNARY